jgi:hypothetical protein
MQLRGRWNWEQVTAVSALVIGVVAMVISAYTAYLQRNQARLAAWPHVQFGVGADFRLTVANKGVGPALVKRVDVRLDGQPLQNWAQLLAATAGPGQHAFNHTTLNRMVLTAGESAVVLELPDADVRQKVQAARARITSELCYCSVYDECWIVDSENDTRPVPACPPPESSSFQQ